ncbi:MAG: hypothetical protein LHV69_06310 [Elusimicrobia bacterium]|nr:hypothetical protein [Candidatus Obscuribacterium magneticum]
MANDQEDQNKSEAEKNKSVRICEGTKACATTVAGASVGVLVGIAGITAAALAEIVLPIGLCLWATGMAGGAVGLIAGVHKKIKKNA